MLHERLKMLRKALNIGSQQKFANDLGISFSNVSSYEMGRRTPSDAVIKLICEKYNVREEWLRDGEGEMFRDVDVDFVTICAEIGIEDLKAKEAIMKYYHLSKEDKELFWKFMDRFSK